MKVQLLVHVLLLTVWLLEKGETAGTNDEASLTDYITFALNELGRVARPVLNTGDTVTVKIMLSVIEVNSVGSDSAEIDCWLNMSWQDPRLRWGERPHEFGGLSSVAMPDNMWLPDIRPYSVLSYQPDREGQIRVLIDKNGTILHVQPARIRFQCNANSPKDRVKNCQMKLGSWVYDAKHVDIMLDGDGVDTSYFTDGDWKLQSASAKREQKTYACCPDAFVSVTYTLALKPKNTKK